MTFCIFNDYSYTHFLGTVDIADFLDLTKPAYKQKTRSVVPKGAPVLTSVKNLNYIQEKEEKKKQIADEKELKSKMRAEQKKEKEISIGGKREKNEKK